MSDKIFFRRLQRLGAKEHGDFPRPRDVHESLQIAFEDIAGLLTGERTIRTAVNGGCETFAAIPQLFHAVVEEPIKPRVLEDDIEPSIALRIIRPYITLIGVFV